MGLRNQTHLCICALNLSLVREALLSGSLITCGGHDVIKANDKSRDVLAGSYSEFPLDPKWVEAPFRPST